RAKLVDELAIEPSPELRELEAAILRHDVSLHPSPPPASFAPHRRLVTILVASVDTLTLTAALDVEAAAAVSQRLLDAVAATVARYGGRLQQSTVDTLTTTFGIPISHEDDALRAARAALVLVGEHSAALRLGI